MNQRERESIETEGAKQLKWQLLPSLSNSNASFDCRIKRVVSNFRTQQTLVFFSEKIVLKKKIMYAEAGLLFPYLFTFSSEIENLEHFYCTQGNNATGNLIQTSEYDLGGEGDLFKAPQPINAFTEEPLVELDPVSAAISMISGGDEVVSSLSADMDSIQNDPLLSEVFYDCKNDMLEKIAIEEIYHGIADAKIQAIQMEHDLKAENDRLLSEGPIQKSGSSDCLSSMEWISGGSIEPSFLDFHGIMRRAFSEGDIQTLDPVNTRDVHPPLRRILTIGNYTTEERNQRLSRYRKKKSKRNFGRKIKYACRKVLADSQPRVRGRFAKTEEVEVSCPSK